MDILDQTLERMEQELYAILERSSDHRITTLLGDIKSIKATKQILLRQTAPIPTAPGSLFAPTSISGGISGNGQASPSPMTQGDAAVEIITKAGHPLHINKILEEMPKYGINTTKVNLKSNLEKDRRKRFRNRGQATFDLNPNGREATENKQKPPSRPQRGFPMKESILAVLPEIKGEISQPTVYNLLVNRHPQQADRIQKASVSTTLAALEQQGVLEITHKGFGSDPRRYRMKGR
jgi:hypothetical protein